MSLTFQGWLTGPGHKSPHWNGQYTIVNTMKSYLVQVDINNVMNYSDCVIYSSYYCNNVITWNIILIFNGTWGLTHLRPDVVDTVCPLMCYCPCQDSLQGDCDLQNVSRASSICSVNIFSILSPFTSIGEDIWHLTMGEQNVIDNIKKIISQDNTVT